MLNPMYVVLLGIALCALLVWFYASRRPTESPFIEAINERYRIGSDSLSIIPLEVRVFGWKRAGLSMLWIQDSSRIGADRDALYIERLCSASKCIPAVRIPLNDLSLVDSKYFRTVQVHLDVFEIDDVADGQLLLPVGYLTDGVANKDG